MDPLFDWGCVQLVAYHSGGMHISMQKAFCDKEMAETQAKKDDNEATIEKLSTKIDSMTAKSSKLKGQVADLQKELAALARTQAEADRLRAEENAESHEILFRGAPVRPHIALVLHGGGGIRAPPILKGSCKVGL